MKTERRRMIYTNTCELSLVFWKGHQSAKYLTVHLWVRFPDGGLLNQRVNTCVILLAVVIQSPSCSDSLQSHELQHARLLCPSLFPGVCSNSCPLSHWCHPTISSSFAPLLLPSVFPNIRIFSKVSALRTKWPEFWSIGFSISPSNEYSGLIAFRIDWFDLLAVRGTLESLPVPQFKSISSSALLHAPAVTSVQDYWENHSFDCMDLCRQSDVSAF